MSRFLQVYEPVEEGVIDKAFSINNYVKRGVQNKVLSDKAAKRDSDNKIVFISETNFKNKDYTGSLKALNPEDFNAFGIFYGIYKQFPSTKLIANKKQVVVSKKFWDEHANDNVLVFSIPKSDCNKGTDLIAQPVVTMSYTVKKEKLKTKKMTISVRKLITKCGWKAVAGKMDGEELK